ncbi:ATP-binding protein [Uliginosibacterium sp. H1]|uniref:ATP-binding protein n=1 Tax=Uliginosibacterium sp. H1 TaxID=3114757 RepID=UPI002E18C5C4|nr:ATP-binding protein [Uliginosibacterium sp. H1]
MSLDLSLVHAAQRLSYARTMSEIVDVLSHAARAASGADGISVVLRDGDLCHYIEEDAISPLWKGRRFPMGDCVSGMCMIDSSPICIEDIYADSRVPHDAYRPTFVKSLALVPIRAADPIGAVGAYWAKGHVASADEVLALQTLADSAALAIENVQLISRLSEESTRKDRFLSMLAHELRSPLGPIRNAGQTISRLSADRPDIQQATAVIERQAAQMGRLVNGLLDASRIANGQVELAPVRVELNALVAGVLDDRRYLADAAGLALGLELPQRSTWVVADPSRIEQAVVNLLENAIKYTRQGRVTAQLHADGDRATLRISDTGCGIATDHLESIFEPFSQVDTSLSRTAGGIGLGLTVARGLIALHGGGISASSSGIGQGSSFTLWLPLAADAHGTHDGARAAAHATPPVDGDSDAKGGDDIDDTQPATGQARVLIIEDNHDAATSMQMFLGLCGHATEIAGDGRSGVALAQRWRPDVVICDIGLPDWDGYEVIARLREDARTAHCPVFAVTGYGDDVRERVAAAGFVAHLVKPADPNELDALIRQHLPR